MVVSGSSYLGMVTRGHMGIMGVIGDSKLPSFPEMGPWMNAPDSVSGTGMKAVANSAADLEVRSTISKRRKWAVGSVSGRNG